MAAIVMTGVACLAASLIAAVPFALLSITGLLDIPEWSYWLGALLILAWFTGSAYYLQSFRNMAKRAVDVERGRIGAKLRKL